MTLRVRVDRARCIGAGNCVFVAPTAFSFSETTKNKAEVLDPSSVEEDLLREAALACPTQAIDIDDVDDILPLRGGLARPAAPRREERTFVFTDIAGSTTLVEALGDEAWQSLIQWHDQTLRSLFDAHGGEVIHHTGDGFFVAFPDPRAALDCAVAIQKRLAEQRRTQGFAPQVRVGVHASEATRVEGDFRGRGVHEAARIAGIAAGGRILASRVTVEDTGHRFAEPRNVELKGLSEPIEVVEVEWQ